MATFLGLSGNLSSISFPYFSVKGLARNPRYCICSSGVFSLAHKHIQIFVVNQRFVFGIHSVSFPFDSFPFSSFDFSSPTHSLSEAGPERSAMLGAAKFLKWLFSPNASQNPPTERRKYFIQFWEKLLTFFPVIVVRFSFIK